MAYKKTPLFKNDAFRELDLEENKKLQKSLQRKIPHNDSLSKDNVNGIFHDVPKPFHCFDASATFNEQLFSKKMSKILKQLAPVCSTVLVSKTFSNAFWLDLDKWDLSWPEEVHPIGFSIDTCYFVAKDFSFGFLTIPYNRKLVFFGKAMLSALRESAPELISG